MPTPGFEYTPSWYHQVSKFKTLATKHYRRPLIALFGDSITEAFAAQEFLPEFSWANRGISGDVTEAALRRLNDSVIALKPDVVCILLGTNDLAVGYTDDEILKNLESILDQLRTNLPSAILILQSILPTRGDPTRPNDRIRNLNTLLRTIAVRSSALYLDLHGRFADERGELPEPLSIDGLHLTGPAYQVWADILRNTLNQLGGR